MKKTAEKLISFFAVLLVCAFVLPLVSFDSFAADGVTMRLAELKKSFPEGYYYNHRVDSEEDKRVNVLERLDEGYAMSISKYPCNGHFSDSVVGTYDCNYFDEGYQCHGFASMLFYQLFGVRQSDVKKQTSKPQNIKPGDLVRVDKDTHSAIVVSVSGDKFTVAECNVTINDEAEGCKIYWGRSYRISDITYYKRATNYSEVASDTNWKNIEKKANGGKFFYAAIYNGSKAVTVESNNTLSLKAYTGAASQVWKFTKLSNGSYKIESCKNGRVLSVTGTVKNGKASVAAAKAAETKKQKWGIYPCAGKYCLSADISLSVLTVKSTGMGIDKKGTEKSKLFSFKILSAPEASKIKASAGNGSVTLSWSKGADTKSFDVEIYNSASKLYKKYSSLTATSLKLTIPAGNYSAKIISKNPYSETQGNTVYFTVSKKGVLGKTAKVTSKQTYKTITLTWSSVPGAQGYGVYIKESGRLKWLAFTSKTTYTAKELSAGKKYTFAIKAYKKSGSKRVYAPEYTSVTAATKLKAPSSLTATQTTSSVTLKWASVKNAQGYGVYRKTSSGWESCGTTTANSKTVKKLKTGTDYTFAVRAYIKTSSGTAWGEMKTLNTATQPAAPQITLSNVKKLCAEIRWNRISGADGYQVCYKFDNCEDYTLLADYSSSDGGVVLSGFTGGVYYTFAVRAYKNVGSKVIYGPYSSVRFKAKY